MKVKILQYKSPRVKINLVEHDKQMEVSRLVFERRCRVGLYEVINPEKMPSKL